MSEQRTIDLDPTNARSRCGRMSRTLAVAALLLAVAPPLPAGDRRTITFPSGDGFPLAASHFDPGRPGPGVLLLHQCNRDRSMWDGLGAGLADAGIHVLAVDYRGYGGSRAEGVDLAAATTREERDRIHALGPLDVRAALHKLTSLDGVDASRIGTGGASCGGPRSIGVVSGTAGLRTMVFLSTYLPDDSLELLRGLGDIPVLAITAENDGRTTSSLRLLFEQSTHPHTRLILYKGDEHGFPLFRQDPRLEATIVDWYRDRLN